LDVTGLAQAFMKGADQGSHRAWRSAVDVADDRQRLLPACSERPRRRAAKRQDELAPPHSITSSARNKSDVGTDSPMARAVRMLSTVSNFAGRSIGKSAGLAPRRTFPATTPVNRYRFSRFGP